MPFVREQSGGTKISVDFGVLINNRWYPAIVKSDGTMTNPISLANKPSSGEFWKISGNNMVATVACHVTGYKIYSGEAAWSTFDVNCNAGSTIMSASYIGGWFMRAEFSY